MSGRVWDSNCFRPFFSLPNAKEKNAVWPRKTNAPVNVMPDMGICILEN